MAAEDHVEVAGIAEAAGRRDGRLRHRRLREHRLGAADAQIRDLGVERTPGRRAEPRLQRAPRHAEAGDQVGHVEGAPDVRLHQRAAPAHKCVRHRVACG